MPILNYQHCAYPLRPLRAGCRRAVRRATNQCIINSMARTKTLKVRVRDKRAKRLNDMARSVNCIWNYVNELSDRAILFSRPMICISAPAMTEPSSTGHWLPIA